MVRSGPLRAILAWHRGTVTLDSAEPLLLIPVYTRSTI